MVKVQKRVVKFVEYRAVVFIARLLYIAGLTALIPLLPLVFVPDRLIEAKLALGFSIGLITVSFFTIFWFTHSKKESLRALGLMTLVPGGLALLFAYGGERALVNIIANLGPITPLVEDWLRNYVPKSWLLAGVYIMLGSALMYVGERVRK